jgi:hypothetical protein
MKYIVYIAAVVEFVALLYLVLSPWGKEGERTVVRDTLTVTDTIAYYQPIAKDSSVVRYVTRVLPLKKDTNSFHSVNSVDGCVPPCALSDDSGSAAVEIPIIQKKYEGADYRAYVSGYEPQLDSIFVYGKTVTIRETVTLKEKKKHWHIGITGGYGFGLHENAMGAFIGLGLTYSLISF